jgi:hypothetical protein
VFPAYSPHVGVRGRGPDRPAETGLWRRWDVLPGYWPSRSW